MQRRLLVLFSIVVLTSTALAERAPGQRNGWGGWSGHGLPVTATGFFHIERPTGASRPYMVDPDGGLFYNMGVNSMCRDNNSAGIDAYLKRFGYPDWSRATRSEWSRFTTGNLFGFNFPNPYYFNSAGAWSDEEDFTRIPRNNPLCKPLEQGGANAPHFHILRGYSTKFSSGLQPKPDADYVLYGLGNTITTSGEINRKQLRASVATWNSFFDPFNPKYKEFVRGAVANDGIAAHRNDRNLIGTWIDNEMGLFDAIELGYGKRYGATGTAHGVHDLRQYVWSLDPAGASWSNPISARWRLGHFLHQKYGGDIAALNRAWGTQYDSFEDVIDLKRDKPGHLPPHPNWEKGTRQTEEDMQEFVHDRLLFEFVRVVTEAIREADPNHLIGFRLAVGYRVNGVHRYNWYGYKHPKHGIVQEDYLPGDTGWAEKVPYAPKWSPWSVLTKRTRPGARVPKGVDLLGLNAYEGDGGYDEEWLAGGVAEIAKYDIPVIISEFSVRANILSDSNVDNPYPRAWTNAYAWKVDVPERNGIDDQTERGTQYVHDTGVFLKIPTILGYTWHAWSDRTYADPQTTTAVLRAGNFGFVQIRDDLNKMKAGQAWSGLQDPDKPGGANYVSRVNREVYHRIFALNGNKW